MYAYQQHRLVARYAETPKLPLVDRPSTGDWALTAIHQGCGEVLQRCVLVQIDTQIPQAHLCQRRRHAGGSLDMHGLQVLVDSAGQGGLVLGSGGREAQACQATGRYPYRDAQTGDGVQAIDGLTAVVDTVMQPGLGGKSGLAAPVVTA